MKSYRYTIFYQETVIFLLLFFLHVCINFDTVIFLSICFDPAFFDLLGTKTATTPGRAAKVVLVYFLGGCSYSEISALRFLGKQTGKYNFHFYVALQSVDFLVTAKLLLLEDPEPSSR